MDFPSGKVGLRPGWWGLCSPGGWVSRKHPSRPGSDQEDMVALGLGGPSTASGLAARPRLGHLAVAACGAGFHLQGRHPHDPQGCLLTCAKGHTPQRQGRQLPVCTPHSWKSAFGHLPACAKDQARGEEPPSWVAPVGPRDWGADLPRELLCTAQSWLLVDLQASDISYQYFPLIAVNVPLWPGCVPPTPLSW